MMKLDHLYQPEPNSGCWIWLASLNSEGRPRVNPRRVNGRNGTDMAYRFTCEAVRGRKPAGLVHSHLCHNKLCVNPDHIIYETQSENLRRRDRLMTAPGSVGRVPNSKSGNWQARITDKNGRRFSIGSYPSEAAAWAAIEGHRNTTSTLIERGGA